MNEKETFQDAMDLAIRNARVCKKKFYILFPFIANPAHHLVVPVVREDAIMPIEREDIAFIVHPNGRVQWNTPKG